VKLISTLIAGGILTVTVATQIPDIVAPAAETVGGSSIQTVVRAAQVDLGVHQGKTPWADALAAAAAGLSQGGEAISIDGTTVRWEHPDTEACFESTVPDVWAPVVVERC
jgi:hypothetical protein